MASNLPAASSSVNTAFNVITIITMVIIVCVLPKVDIFSAEV